MIRSKSREDIVEIVAAKFGLSTQQVRKLVDLQFKFVKAAITIGDISPIRLPKLGTIKVKDYEKVLDYDKFKRKRKRVGRPSKKSS